MKSTDSLPRMVTLSSRREMTCQVVCWCCCGTLGVDQIDIDAITMIATTHSAAYELFMSLLAVVRRLLYWPVGAEGSPLFLGLNMLIF
jgi:hypothetical protein